MYERSGRPSDPFKAPFPNEQAARAANNGALPPDLTLIVEARKGGANHVFGVLNRLSGAARRCTIEGGPVL
jgi:ubiquinol-cytochrome c reductase cytochrome c1 subunit